MPVFVLVFLTSFGVYHNAFADTTVATVPVGNTPTDVAVNPITNMIYVTNYADNTISVINGSTNGIVSTIPVGSHPAFVQVNPVTNKIYVSNTFSYSISVIDGATNTVKSTISGVHPYGIGIDPTNNMVYASCQYCNNVYVINGTNDSVVNTLSGPYHNQGVGVNPVTNMVYVSGSISGANNGITIINGSTNSVTGSIQFGSNPFYVGVNPNTNKLYVSDYGIGTVYVIDGTTNGIVGKISGFTSPYGVVVNPVTNKIYVANGGGSTVSVIDGATNNVIGTISVGGNPWGVGANPNTNKVYVANSGSSTVSVINGSSSGTSSTATAPSAPQNLRSTAGNSQVSLSWTASSSNGGSTITGYNVYRGTSSGAESLLTSVSAGTTSYTDTAVTNGVTYYYYVTAVNSVGTSGPSNEASATPMAPATVSSAPTGLTATTVSSSQINLSWTAPASNGGSQVTGYMIQRSADSGATWSTIISNSGSTSTAYSDTGLAASTTYTYQVSAINSVGTSPPSNTASATTSGVTIASGIVLNNVQSTSGTASNQITISNFNTGTGSNQLLLVGISANNNSPAFVTFNGMPLTQAVSSFFNNDAEFWYLKNPSGTGNIVVTMSGPTQAVVGAYSFSGVSQTLPIPTSVTDHNTTPNSPNVSITTKYPNDMVLDLPSIWGGVALGSPTCTQQWDVNVPNAITGASSSTAVQSPAAMTCKWTASSVDFWDDVAVELKAAG